MNQSKGKWVPGGKGRPTGSNSLCATTLGELRRAFNEYPDETPVIVGTKWAANYPILKLKGGTASQVTERFGDCVEPLPVERVA